MLWPTGVCTGSMSPAHNRLARSARIYTTTTFSRKSRGISEVPSQNANVANTALPACKSTSLGAIDRPSMPCSKDWATRWRCDEQCHVVVLLIGVLDHEGVDVSWRPDLCAPSGFPHHWPYDIRALCRHRPQRETTLRHTISSGGDALSTGKRGDLPIRSQRLWLQKQLDYGMDKYIYTWTFVIEALYDAAVGGVYREGSCSHP